jgi:hypothetical protein
MPSAAVPPRPDFRQQTSEGEFRMLKFYFNGSPNPTKVALFLEEAGLAYEPVAVDTRKGDQFSPQYLAVNPNAKVPSPKRPASFFRRPRRPTAPNCCPG